MGHERKHHPQETNKRKKNLFTDSISQHIAEIEVESLEVYFVVVHTQSVIQEKNLTRMRLAKSRLNSRPDGHTTRN
jgi:hypothetical protein